ncbi:DUF2690 domain-containing protein [Streptomyces sp. NRRL S-31]|uniref:DUF2690 domain-containing protein n=1 Tax=Streptomyces sp. NRRL S-31 TaxID=1463898 RepID=UPI003463ABFB
MPEDLDPQIREFTGRLRQLVDRSGLGVAALADRTGYSTTSWERYLGGGLLAPKGAVIALAEATGSPPGQLTTLWELAERAWSRAERRQGGTGDALRVAEARVALGGGGAAAAPVDRTEGRPADRADTDKRAGKGAPEGSPGGAGAGGGRGTGQDGAATAVPGTAGPAGVSPTLPVRPTAPDVDVRDGRSLDDRLLDRLPEGTGTVAAADGADTSAGNSWGLAGYRGPSPASARPGARPPARPNGPADDTPSGPADTPARAFGAAPGPGTADPGTADPDDGRSPAPEDEGRWSARRQQVTMFLAGLIGVLALIGGVLFLTHRDGGGHDDRDTAVSPAPSAPARTSPPPGVKCAGTACAGRDAEAMGCSGDLVTTAKTATVGATTLEVRYSRTCGTAWGRITSGAPGDTVRVTVGKERQTGDITDVGDTIGYTPMVVVRNPAQARACATLASGLTGCTE